MVDILIANTYFYKLDDKQWRYKQPYPPLGTLWASSVLRSAGFTISFFDTNLRDSSEEIIPELEKLKPRYLIIYDDGFNYLTKMCLEVMREQAYRMAEEGKRNNCCVIVCSSDASDHYTKYFAHGVDFVVRGEGEETLLELLSAHRDGSDISAVKGIAYPSSGQSEITPSRSVLRDLDSLPMPAWDLVDFNSYSRIWNNHHGYFSLNIATTRGCPYKCNWCAKPIYGNRYHSRSPEKVVEEIYYLIQHTGARHFWMCDDIFGLTPGWINQFNEAIKKKEISFQYKIQSRVDLLLKEDTIKTLAESGAETIWIGAESGSQKILDAMDKGITVSQIHEATQLIKSYKMKVAFFLQFGYLGETQEDVDATLNMVLDLMPDEIGISISYPLPGTKFYEKVKDQLKEKQNWNDSDDLAMMFQGTYVPAYYRILHRYIHNRYRIQRGINMLKVFFSKKISIALYEFASMIYNIPLAIFHYYQLHQLRTHGKS